MPTKTPHITVRSLLVGLFAIVLSLSTAQAQDTVAQAQSEPDRQDKLVHYSLYYENYKNENFKRALEDLNWILDHAPTFVPNKDQGDDRHFRRAYNAYTELADQAEDAETKKEHLQAAYEMLQRAPEELEAAGAEFDRYRWTMRKGRFVQQYGDLLDEVDTPAIQYYQKAFEMAPDKIQPYYIDQLIQGHLKADEQQEALALMEQIEERRGDNEEVQEILESYREDIFGRDPSARIDFLEGKLEDNPEDVQTMGQLFELYLDQGQRGKALELSSRLLDLNPPLDIIQQIAKMRLEDGEAQEAFALYEQGIEMSEKEPSAEYYYNMGVAQRQLENPAEARRYFREAINANESFGQAYIAIGDLYARAVSDCGGSEMGRNDRAVYWLAVDMYQQAKEADSSVASTANSKIQTYRQYFPSAEDLFYREDWQEGGSFRIDYGCYSWINESTTVRKAPSS